MFYNLGVYILAFKVKKGNIGQNRHAKKGDAKPLLAAV
jgi:hypothetical protein